MKEDILSYIQNNHEISRIHSELKAGFLAYNRVTLPRIREKDREEIYNDFLIGLIDNVSSEKLRQLTCNLQTCINTISYSKSIDLLHEKNPTQSLPDCERIEPGNDFGIADGTNDAIAVECREEIYKLIKDTENDTCRIILFGFYWQRYSMGVLAELTGLSNAGVVESTKARCFIKLQNAALAAFQKKGLIQYGCTGW